MGTETTNKHLEYRNPCRIDVKLNNPLMGTETLSPLALLYISMNLSR